MSYFEPRRPALSSRNVFTLYKAVLLAWGTDISVLSLCTPDEVRPPRILLALAAMT